MRPSSLPWTYKKRNTANGDYEIFTESGMRVGWIIEEADAAFIVNAANTKQHLLDMVNKKEHK